MVNMKDIRNNQKGFTLVELVVVIAILAILAAVAVPAVINIIDSAAQSQGESQASTIDLACRVYYSGVRTGSINATNYTPEKTDDIIPDKGLPSATRLTMAKNCTVAGAMEYEGIYSDLISRITDFGYDDGGHIKFIPPDTDDASEVGLTRLPDDGKVTFAELKYVA